MLGMCMTLRGRYEVTSNLEAGFGRSDITLKAMVSGAPNVVMEFKQGDNLEGLANQALEQILEQQYYYTLKGKVLCIGIAHNKKQCSIVHKMIDN